MILSRQQLNYKGKPLLEKLIVRPPFRYEAAFDQEGCFIYVDGGDLTFLSAGGVDKSNNQDFTLLNCGNYLVDFNSEEGELTVFAFHLHQELLLEIDWKGKIAHEPGKEVRTLSEAAWRKFVAGLDFYFDLPEWASDDIMALKIRELILVLIQSNRAPSITELFDRLFTPRQIEIEKVINLHLYSNLAVEELAKLCAMSLSTFKREFKKHFDDSPAHYLLTKRLGRAVELFQSQDLSIAEVAYRSGFGDPAYFTRAFKKHYGASPSIYKEGLIQK